jgi:3-hydroxyisobutyrate dehydrogenase-like beta-hydroxyacid dehydrogenase
MAARTPEAIDRMGRPSVQGARIGWIGTGRMGYAMAERLAKGGANLTVWNRTRAKAEPLAALGAKIAAALTELAACDIVFVMVSTWDDVKEVVCGPGGLLSDGARAPKMLIECSSISLDGSAELRELLVARKIEYLAAPVSGNAKVIKAGRLSFVCSGPKESFDAALPYLRLIAPAASYVGEGELARIVKICHNVFLGVVTQSLAEITILAQKAGVPRHAFLEFMNQSVMGSTFSRYKTPAFVNLDFKVTFTPYLLRKDLDLGLDAGRRFEVPMPLASVTRDILQTMIGRGMTKEDFAQLLVLQAEASGLKLEPENVPVSDGL